MSHDNKTVCSNTGSGLHNSLMIKQVKGRGMLQHSDQWFTQRHSSPFLSKSISAAVNEPLCNNWAEFVLFVPLSCAARRKPASPCAHSTCIDTRSFMSWTPSELGNGFTPLDAAVSTSAHTTTQSMLPVSNQAVALPAVSNYSFSKYLILEYDGSLFSAFPP